MQSADSVQQIWTQGETEFNSRWFPTVDKPNERCTQEMYITVDDRFKTLSNGYLNHSVLDSTQGKRTDHWVMELPHAPYLFMVAVGEFAVKRENHKGLELSYYVEPEYEESAKEIFNHTPEMIDFFSEKLNYPFPWTKYAQIAVREFVSGAMENTTAVIFGDFVQKDRRALVDDHNDYIVAHELFHHWFGDLVTCESWANLTMNEGFANYSEYLWFEHKYGNDYADNHRLNELGGYLSEASYSIHPLIHFSYSDKEEMFDAHSYNKGGLVLHMLRSLIGDEAFFEALHIYLRTHEYTAVEVHDLRLAIEEVTGLDWNWFFNQWFLSAGHPMLNCIATWDSTTNTLQYSIEQIQQGKQVPTIFRLPTQINIVTATGELIEHPITLNKRREEISFELEAEPRIVVLDPAKILLAQINQNFSKEQYKELFYQGFSYFDRYLAVQASSAESTDDMAFLLDACKDPFWAIRNIALTKISWEVLPSWETLRNLTSDEHSMVRANAINLLGYLGDDKSIDAIKSLINDKEPYVVVAAAIASLGNLAPEEALEVCEQMESENNGSIISAIASVYAGEQDLKKLPFFTKNLNTFSGYEAFDFYFALEEMTNNLPTSDLQPIIEKVLALTANASENGFTRVAGFRTLVSFSNREDIGSNLVDSLQIIAQEEQEPQIKNIFDTLLSSQD